MFGYYFCNPFEECFAIFHIGNEGVFMALKVFLNLSSDLCFLSFV